MKCAILICFLGLAAFFAAARPDHYTDRYDNIDLDEILENKKLLEPYIKCCLDQGRCTPDGKELKSHISEALATHCEKCTEAQKNGTKKVIKHLINHEVDYWNQLKAKYDPEGVFSKQYEDELREAIKE